MNWTTNDIPPMDGKTIVITGANTGLGYDTANELAKKKGHVILACRNMEKANNAVERIKADMADADVVAMELDLSDLASVRAFSGTFAETYDSLDLLINNAGVMMCPYQQTADGLEMQLGVNHFGHFALTGRLLDQLENADAARVVNLSSQGHRMGDMNFDNLMYEGGNGYTPLKAYGRSKLANLLFTFEMQRRLETHGRSTIAVAAHPGSASTDLGRHIEKRWWGPILKPVLLAMVQSSEMGALPTLRAATDPTVKGSDYFGPKGFQQQRGYPVRVDSTDLANNPDVASKLWDVSQELTGVSYL